MKIKLKTKEKEYDVEIADSDGAVRISVNGKEFCFDNGNPSKEITAPQTILPKRDFSKKIVKTAIAGVISGVFVKAGDIVKSGQKLLTLSAMKMENEIVSDADGQLKEVKVKQNDRVKEGDTLVVLV